MFRAATSMKRLFTRSMASKWVLVPVAAAALGLPSLARADSRFDRGRDDRNSSWSDHRDYGHHDYDHGHGGTNVGVDIRIGGAPRPVYREREVRVWVPATY